MEMKRLKSAQFEAERQLDARERVHRERIRGLEEQVMIVLDYCNTASTLSC